MFAITQTEYYLTLLKYIGLATGAFVGAVACSSQSSMRSSSTPITGNDL